MFNDFAHDPLSLIFRFSQEEKDDLRECEVVRYQYQGEIRFAPVKFLVDHISGVIIFNDKAMIHIKDTHHNVPKIFNQLQGRCGLQQIPKVPQTGGS